MKTTKEKPLVIWVNPENEQQKRLIRQAAAAAGMGMGPFLLKLGLEAAARLGLEVKK